MKFTVSRTKAKNVLITIDKFSGGTNKLIDEAKLDKKFAVESTNMMQDQDGIWKTKWGSKTYGTVLNVEAPQSFDNGYSHRRLITMDATKVATATNFVVYIDVTYSYLATTANGGDVESASGHDIRFEDVNGNKLSHEILDWDDETGLWQGYVKIPSLGTSLNTFYVYYGNSSVVATEADPSNVFPATLKAQYRFKDGALTTDSSGNTNTLTAIGVPVQGTPKFGGCVGLGTSQAYSAVDDADFRPAGNFSISAWMRTTKTGANQYIFQSFSQNTNWAGIALYITSTDNKINFATGKNTGTTNNTDYKVGVGATAVTDGAWHHVVLTFDTTNYQLYLDGATNGSAVAFDAPAYAETNYVRVGVKNSAGTSVASTYFQGLLDDVAFFPSDALTLEEVQSLYAASINDASNSAILAKAKAVYLFEDGALTTDSSGEGNTLTAIGTPTAITTKFGGSVFLGNSSAYSITDHESLKPTGAFTVGGWVKTSTTGANQCIFQSFSLNPNYAGFSVKISSGGYPFMWMGQNTGTTNGVNYRAITATAPINDGNWHFIVAVWDTAKMYFYTDGVSSATPVTWANAPVYAATNYVRVGGQSTTSTAVTQTALGQLDGVFLKNGTAMSADEILTEYNNSLPNFLSSADEVLEYFDLDGSKEFVKADGTTELITIAGGKAFKSVDGGAWSEISGATFTAGLQCYFMQISGYLYIANGTDDLARYDGTVLTKYTAIDAPTNLTASLTASGLTSGVYPYYAQVTAINLVGETIGSTEASIVVNKLRDNWVSSTDKVVWSWTGVAGATRYQIYLTDQSGYENLLGNSEVTNFTDDGTSDINPYVEVPDDNTTGAPKFISMALSGNRIWATNNSENRYRVYFSGTGQYIGTFSDFYGGGWIDLEKGGRENPIAVQHYQSGQGAGIATVLCKTPDGRGAVWQINITTATVGTTSFAVPSASKVVGSFGTESVLGVVNTTNDIAFPNRKGWFFLGPVQNYMGILRTTEVSSNIRPYWRSLNGSGMSGIAAYFYDAKIFIAVPSSSSGNDKIIIYDTERNNWAVEWTNQVKQFLDYTDTSGNTHFLYVPTTGKQLIELSENYNDDLGSAFNQSYVSPLLPISTDKTDILSLRESVLELGRPKGIVNFQLQGVGKDGVFVSLASSTISSFGSNTGVGTDLAGECYAGETNASVKGGQGSWAIYLTDSPETYTQSSVKRGIKKKARLYGIQYKVSSTYSNTSYSILSIQSKGSIVRRKMPSQWTQ